MSQKTRWVVLDCGSESGTYTNSWYNDNDEHSFMGTLYNGTVNEYTRDPLHSMTFAFNGTEFLLFGKSDPSRKGDIPRWSCTVDGAPAKLDSTGTPGPFTCSWKGSADNTHTFRLSLESQGSVAIDSIWYLPTYNSTAVGENAYVVFNHDDPNVSKHTGNWTTFSDEGETATLTTEAKSSLSLAFTGTGVYAEGWSPANFPAGNSRGTYSLGGKYDQRSFDLEPPNPPSETIHGKKLFEVKYLQSPGEFKNLTVTYDGPSTPLVLQRFFVKEGNFRIGDNPLAPQPSASGGSTPANNSNSGIDTIGNIVKIAVPSVIGFFVLMFLIGCFTGCFGRKKKPVTPHQGDKDFELTQQPIPYAPPTYYPPHNGSGTHLMQPDQFQQPYYPDQFQQPYPPPPPPPPYQRPEVTQNLTGLSVDGGGQANVAGRDANNITIHNLTIHPDAFNPPRPTL